MDFIFIFGPQSVGKMTIGQELAKKLNYRLFYNHLSIDIAGALYDVSDREYFRYLASLNLFTFLRFIKKPSAKGLIYTDVWTFNYNFDNRLKGKIFELFYEQGWSVYLIELSASLEIRLERNRTENRLKHKPTKRDINLSNARLIDSEKIHIVNSFLFSNFKLPDTVKKHIIIETDKLAPEEVADKIMIGIEN